MRKTAIITGASRGIDNAVARYFAIKDYNLVLIARNKQALYKVKKELKNINSEINISYYALDLADFNQSYQQLVKMVDELERIDVLVNNAGIGYTGTLDLDLADFSLMVDVNVKGLFAVAKAVGLKMKQQQHGYIINVASVSGKSASPYLGGYAATKFAVVGFNQALAKELRPFGVKVTALCPGVVATEMTKGFDFPEENKLTVDELVSSVDYLLKLGPNAVIETLDVAAAS
ncbi:SDR family oxidoreductase [Piscirickettsia litoralis]|uniref:Short-chain dehydrogenase n=1 Tax=Piscirickettsia litoralis TaxID=1891921 RepID=A0ABX3A4N9_9GAMM|nr:SDR family NAD(P)-dependent oxidoreductase [Piscirickettsia litoralis]ODN42608.1 hypothetical protein BGC07_06300 [Piscirickettsia litoralis]